MKDLIHNYPANNLERGFDCDDFTAILLALEEVFGPRGGCGLALQAGRATFNGAIKNFGALAGVGDLAFKVLPLVVKIRIGLPASARIFSRVTDQLATVGESDNEFYWTIHRCPICWTRKNADKPICYITTGLLQAMMTWVSGGLNFRINESKCYAIGDTVCEFIIQKEPVS